VLSRARRPTTADSARQFHALCQRKPSRREGPRRRVEFGGVYRPPSQIEEALDERIDQRDTIDDHWRAHVLSVKLFHSRLRTRAK
jgi:hypothetical protein